jgi:hypothetical protein
MMAIWGYGQVRKSLVLARPVLSLHAALFRRLGNTAIFVRHFNLRHIKLTTVCSAFAVDLGLVPESDLELQLYVEVVKDSR